MKKNKIFILIAEKFKNFRVFRSSGNLVAENRRKFLSRVIAGGGAFIGGTASASTAMTKDYLKFPDNTIQVTAMADPSGKSGKVLSSVGGKTAWVGKELPSPIDHNSRILISDGVNASWQDNPGSNDFTRVGNALNIVGDAINEDSD